MWVVSDGAPNPRTSPPGPSLTGTGEGGPETQKRAFPRQRTRKGSWYHPCSRAATRAGVLASQRALTGASRARLAHPLTDRAHRSGSQVTSAEAQPGEARSRWLPFSCGAFPPTPPGHRQCVQSLSVSATHSVYARERRVAIRLVAGRRLKSRLTVSNVGQPLESPRRRTSWLEALQVRF